MSEKRECMYCYQSFDLFRSDASFCGARCRYRYHYEKRIHDKEKATYLAELSDLKQELDDLVNEGMRTVFLKALGKGKEKEKEKEEQIENSFLETKRQLDLLDDQAFLTTMIDRELDKHEKGSEQWRATHYKFRYMSSEELQRYVDNWRTVISNRAKEIKAKQTERANRPIYIEKRIGEIKLRIAELEPLTEQEYKPVAPDQPPVKREKVQRPRTTRELGGADVRNMSFISLRLTGELGRFLGELDRNMVAFALTGDAGAGKSYFSFEIAKLFLDNNLKVKYYSLEEGIGKLTQQKLLRYGIGNELKITDNATLQDVQKDAAYFDVLIIDSYSKLSEDPHEFENLRQDNPRTIFVVVFQKTTAKTMRGGASIKYNSSATINVTKHDEQRVAVMEKGRYGTQGWVYSIDRGRIVKES